jgi:hypothetical protein
MSETIVILSEAKNLPVQLTTPSIREERDHGNEAI